MSRERKPTALHRLDGTYNVTKHKSREAEPQPAGRPIMPRGLDYGAKSHWCEIVPQLVEMGVGTEADSAALGEMCRWWSKLQKQHKSDDIKSINAATTCFRCWSQIASKFGLTPADRAKLVVEEPKKSKAAGYIAA